MDNSYNIITIPEIRTPDQSQGFYNAPIEDTQLNVGNNRDISWMKYFAMDVFATSWSTWDGTFRVVKLVWSNWDRGKSYTGEIITALGNTTATITKSYTIDTPKNNIIYLQPWQTLKAQAYFSSATMNLRINRTWSIRYLKSWNADLTNANPDVTFINSGNTVSEITLRFATSASDRPTFGILIEIF